MNKTVKEYYDRAAQREWERLARPYRRLEFASTVRLLDKYFPKEGRIVDIGGGPGRYTIELLRRGYSVTLVDLSDGLLEVARTQMAEAGVKADAVIAADACDLGMLASESFDGALLMGPMYHLTGPESRLAALLEMKRVLKPGGVAVVSFINSWGLLRSFLTEVPRWYRSKDAIMALTGDYVNPAGPDGFTEAYFTTPPKAFAEITGAGFSILSHAGVESYASGALEQVIRMAQEDPEAYENMIATAAELAEEPCFRDATEHLHVVVRKS